MHECSAPRPYSPQGGAADGRKQLVTVPAGCTVFGTGGHGLKKGVGEKGVGQIIMLGHPFGGVQKGEQTAVKGFVQIGGYGFDKEFWTHVPAADLDDIGCWCVALLVLGTDERRFQDGL